MSGRLVVRRVPLLLFSLAVAGCEMTVPPEGTADLAEWMTEAARPLKGRVKPLPEVRTVVPLAYAAYELTDPFALERFHPAPPPPAKGADHPGLPGPDLSREREPLEAFAFEDLILRGVIERQGARWALIVAPDGRLYRVTVGNYLGRDFGRITAITPSEKRGERVWRVVVTELVRDDEERWQERKRELVSQGKGE
ncbi:pilus assembly protein PilP [Hydrogenophilus islandicus]